jgi:hypothetical protein
MNFTHFVSTTTTLEVTKCRNMLHRLLREQAAPQLAPQQELWDLLIPIYLGDINAPFDRNRVTAMLVQVKNTDDPNPHKPDRTKYEKYLDLDPTTPIITILLDLWQTRNKIKRMATYDPNVFAIRVSGCGQGAYACIDEEKEKLLKRIINHKYGKRTRESVTQWMKKHNQRFQKLDFEGAFPHYQRGGIPTKAPGTSPPNIKKDSQGQVDQEIKTPSKVEKVEPASRKRTAKKQPMPATKKQKTGGF